MAALTQDPRAPMSSAPMKYDSEGRADWGNMWDSFCVLALAGGPPHRATLLAPDPQPDPAQPAYAAATAEIVRGVAAVSGLAASPARPGWIAVECGSAAKARWLADAIVAENVSAKAEATALLVPVAAGFRLEGEVKNVITAVAKTTHYWQDHLPTEAKQTLAAEVWLGEWWSGWRRRLGTWRAGARGG